MLSQRLTALATVALVPLALAQPGIICGYDRIGEISVTGSLKFFQTGSYGLSLPASGANVSYAPESLSYGATAAEEGFTFQSCNSAYMGYPAQVTEGPGVIAYGQLLTPAGEPLTVNYTAGRGPYHIRQADRSLSDDSSQLLQYWSLTNSSDGLELNFNGVTANGTSGTGVDNLTFWYYLNPQVYGTPILIETFLPQDEPEPIYSLRLIPE